MTKQPDKLHPVDTPTPAGHDHVLGKIQPGEFDTELKPAPSKTPQGAAAPPAGTDPTPPAIAPGAQQGAVKGLEGLQKRKGASGTSSPAIPNEGNKLEGSAATPLYSGADDALRLPVGGLIAMRKSGGLRFSSQRVTVYMDGRVEVVRDTAQSNAYPQHAGKLSDSEVAALYRALFAASFEELPPSSGHQNPDGYAYEIAAHIAGSNYSIEAFDGSIPAPLSPLIQLLASYMGRPASPDK